MNYIGCDRHISTLDCAVVNDRGQETNKQKMDTGVKGIGASPRCVNRNTITSPCNPSLLGL
jgi:hypothetical protein